MEMSLLVMTASRRLLYGHMHCSGVDLRVSWLSFRIFVLLKRLPSLPLHHPGIWQQIFIMNILVYFSVNTSFSYMKRTCAICLKKQLHSTMFPPQDFTICVFGQHEVPPDLQTSQRVQLWSHLTRLYFPSILQACLNVLEHVFSSAIGTCMVNVHTGHGSCTTAMLYIVTCQLVVMLFLLLLHTQ